VRDKQVKETLKGMLSDVSPWHWALDQHVTLQGGDYSFKDHEWQAGPMISDHKHKVVRKGAQLGFTECEVLRTLHGLIHGQYSKGVLYLFPTSDDVADFSKARFGPLIASNPETVGRYVRKTDSTNIKQIGTGMLYLRGARLTANIEGTKKDSPKLRSVPVDKLVFDERDLMSDAAILMAKERLSHSTVKEMVEFSTPTVPDYGIDKAYNESTQHVWMIRCEHCNEDTCLEMEFPECIRNNKRVCVYCGREIFSRNGQWVALYPDRSVEGYWLSQLNSAFVEPEEILKLFNNPPQGNLQEIYNSKLGMAYVSIEDRLSQQRVYACCTDDAMSVGSKVPCSMGVDVGKVLHVVIGQRVSKKQCKIIYVGEVESFEALHDLAARFSVQSAVLDAYPELHKVREFIEAETYPGYLCQYQDTISGEQWNDNTCIVKVNRTEICDKTHSMFDSGLCAIPRRSKLIDGFAKQVCNIVKMPRDAKTGRGLYFYKKLGADHYRHATNYFSLATFAMPVPRTTGQLTRFHNWGNR
jgi:hypothetical protein